MLFFTRKNTETEKNGTVHSPITLFNTASSSDELFSPLKPKTLTMYSCGPTVYDYVHIGNLRAFLLPDLIKRLFSYHGYVVKNTINFTDFGHLVSDGDDGEDKMMKALRRHNKPITLDAMKEVAQIYIDAFKKDFIDFGNIEPTNWTPASEYVYEQIQLVKTLIEKGYAYETPDGVYFDISTFPAYGILGGVNISEIKEGARVEANPHKRHAADFALWKKGLLGWESDWGKGFPGWHIECTAMVFATLGKQIDIHTGGEDLKYTHHNGEIAQAEAITHKQYVRYWMHNAHLLMYGQKISKSLGNGVSLDTIREKGYSPKDFRYLLLTGHYRSQMNFTYEALTAAKTARARLSRIAGEHQSSNETHTDTQTAILSALGTDLNTAKAIASLWEMINNDSISPEVKSSTVRWIDPLLGILDTQKEEVNIPEEITILAKKREEARNTKNWLDADRIREEIFSKGYIVRDTQDGSVVEKHI